MNDDRKKNIVKGTPFYSYNQSSSLSCYQDNNFPNQKMRTCFELFDQPLKYIDFYILPEVFY